MAASRPPVVDPNDRTTWPEEVAGRVFQLAAELEDTTEFTSDLDLHDEEDPFRALLAGHLIQTYHCTRLLDHEVKMVREQGLRALDKELLQDRFDAALERGCISDEQYRAFLGAHVFNDDPTAPNRRDQVCLVLGQAELRSEWPSGIEALLTTWGGEGLYMGGSEAARLRPLLTELGRPSIVVASVDLSEPHRGVPVWPGVANVFVGAALGLDDAAADVHYPRGIPAGQIEDIWQPGHPEYNRNAALPR